MSDNINIIDIIKNIPNNLELTSQMLIVAVLGIVIVIVELGVLAVLIQGISKAVRALESAASKKTEAPAAAVAPAAAAPVPAAPSAGVQLFGVDEPTAAVIMAIVSNESGIPLDRLNFKSIKITEDK